MYPSKFNVLYLLEPNPSFLLGIVHGVLLLLRVPIQHKECKIWAQVTKNKAKDWRPILRNRSLILVIVNGSHCFLGKLRRVHSIIDIQVRLPELLPRRPRKCIFSKISANVSRHNVANPNAEGTQFGTETVKNADEGVLGTTVGGPVGSGELAGLTGNADNVTTLILDHMRDHCLQMVVGTVHVDVVETNVVLERIVHELATHRQAGVLHDHVDTLALGLKIPDEFLGESADLLEVCHVHGKHFSILRVLAAGLHPLQFLDITGREDDVGPETVELVGHILANPRGSPSHPHQLIVVVWLHSLPTDEGDQRVQDQQTRNGGENHRQILINIHNLPQHKYRGSLNYIELKLLPIQIFLQGTMQKIGGRQLFPNSFSNSPFNTVARGSAKGSQEGVEWTVGKSNSPLRGSPVNTSPKMKIRLVSPFKAGNTQKENIAVPQSKASNSFNKEINQGKEHKFEIQLGGRSSINSPASRQNTNAYIISAQKQPTKRLASPNYQDCNRENKTILESHVSTPTFCIKGSSPSKIRINNKCFDIGSLQAKITFVTPLDHRTSTVPNQMHKQPVYGHAFATQVSIQQEDGIQNLKHSYQSQMREIRQLQKEIQSNNVKIKQLLKGSSSRLTSTSRTQIHHQQLMKTPVMNTNTQVYHNYNPSMQTKQTLINQLDFATHNHSESQRDGTSVQTDHQQMLLDHSMERSDSRSPKFAIFRSNQCQIKLISSLAEVQLPSRVSDESQYTFANNIDLKSTSPLKNTDKVQPIEFQTREIEKQLQVEIIPISQRSLTSETTFLPYEIKVNLKCSRADGEYSIIEESLSVIQLKEEAKAATSTQILTENPNKSTPIFSKINQQPITPINSKTPIQSPSIKSLQKQQNPPSVIPPKGQAGRRMNNSRYL